MAIPSTTIFKLHPDGTVKEWPKDVPFTPDRENDWVLHGYTSDERDKKGNPVVYCGCGSESWRLSWWDYPWIGGYCKIVCTVCGQERILINNYMD
jgi:hypothetical protein